MGGRVIRGFSLFLPWPPSTNRLWRAVGRGRAVKALNYRLWQKEAGAAVMMQRPVPIACPVAVTIRLTPPNKREYDIDNRVKALLDLIVSHGLIKSDGNRTLKSLTVIESSAEPGVIMEVVPWV